MNNMHVVVFSWYHLSTITHLMLYIATFSGCWTVIVLYNCANSSNKIYISQTWCKNVDIVVESSNVDDFTLWQPDHNWETEDGSAELRVLNPTLHHHLIWARIIISVGRNIQSSDSRKVHHRHMKYVRTQMQTIQTISLVDWVSVSNIPDMKNVDF